MSKSAARSEILRRIKAGELPIVADFIVVQAKAGDGTCHGCGTALSAGEPRCVIDCAAANFGPLPMHAGCFLLWSEACMRELAGEDPDHKPDGATRATPIPGRAPAWYALETGMFCQTRLEMLTTCVRGAHDFAEAVRRMRKSKAAGARKVCEQARRQSRLAREAYDDHVAHHGC
jgi:hypothetical protein